MKTIIKVVCVGILNLIGFATHAQPCTMVPACTVSWWPANGDTLDNVSGYNGSLQNGATFANGVVCDAFSLDGSNDYVLVNDAAPLRFTTNMTVAAWVNPTTIHSVANEVLSKWGGSGSQRAYTLSINPSGYAYFHVSSDGGYINTAAVISTVTIPTNQWTHIAAVYNGTALKIYINGQLDNTASFSSGIFPGTANIVIGTSLAAGSYFHGLIDEPALYGCALSDSEIETIFEAYNAGKCF